MNRFYYDFHIHSCLSPCAENDMTPHNIAGIAVLAGLDIAALTDHNSCKNCPAFFEAAGTFGLIPVAGMELTTAEDIHVVCLFETLEGALEFDAFVDARRMKVQNNVRIFGEQLILDAEDEPIGTEAFFLPTATSLMIDDVPDAVARFGGISYPAHIDREANGAIATLGAFPETPGFLNAEFYDAGKRGAYLEQYPILRKKRILVSSDAHNLGAIRDKSACLTLDAARESEREARATLFRCLREAAG